MKYSVTGCVVHVCILVLVISERVLHLFHNIELNFS